MSEKKKQPEQRGTVTAQAGVKETKQAGKFPKPCVYCGPSVKGVARQYTVYTGEVPSVLAEFIKEHPEARGLVVSMDRFAEVRKNLGMSGAVEAILFEKIKADL